MSYRHPRVRVSGILRLKDSILLVQQGRPSSPRWMLPGGGVDPGETMKIALQRELSEELSCPDCTIGDPVALVESIAPEGHRSGRHVIHAIFTVEAPDVSSIVTGRQPGTDPALHEIRWVHRDDILKLPLHPPIGQYLKSWQDGDEFQYFGAMWAP